MATGNAGRLTLGFVSAVAAQPIEFKGISIGKPYPDSDPTKKLHCVADGKCKYFGVDHGDGKTLGTIAGADVKAMMVEQVQGDVTIIWIQFPSRDFGDVLSGFRAKYPGLKCEESTVQNRMGRPSTRSNARIATRLGRCS